MLRKAVRRTEATLHTPRGAAMQLLGVVARQSAGSLGGVLRSFVLRQAQLAGVQSVCGVTRCCEWTGEDEGSYADYVEKGSDRGLRFHLNAGARMCGLVTGYRPEDTANEGHGVLVDYCLGDEEEPAEDCRTFPKSRDWSMEALMIPELLERQAEALGSRPFLQIWAEGEGVLRTLSFATFAAHVRAAEAALRGRGVRPEDRVGLLSHPSEQFFTYTMGVLRCGAVSSAHQPFSETYLQPMRHCVARLISSSAPRPLRRCA